ncbi:urease accessory protein UreD [Aliarcobacter butzleri]|uniref:urease accessory protein UreD n=1 Tax=Aliarcobacter butzleri TaxID=28197 RepID=UPI001EDBE991|nr:urease accessory protein UreD [Aliarcobacter butzleri]MCG3706962.1 urease accessory protein UreD [Aliarcobacter butzleri]MCT7585964.1 urease accessory protein UreD [Aliarcobacter butzleri]MDN5061161.1 urease accessory protein UreD [Aliarcobacter butzleri]MDN5126722.1 urease accessory protein UreD [Aliarcobacter butzleri]
MSIKFSFKDEVFSLDKLQLPSRNYYFNDNENYIKLLNIGEGIFPKDKIRISLSLDNSNLILTTESATKIYPSKKEFGIQKIDIVLENNSNLEFINDELILYKESRYIQFFNLKSDENSTFFYTDILSRGRSFENFDFSNMLIKNSFYCEKSMEYMEKFDVKGAELKDYISRKSSSNFIFAKIYIKTNNNEEFLNRIYLEKFESFTYTKNKKIILGVISSNNMFELKNEIFRVWEIYRKELNKSKFNLGKQ